MSPLVPGPAVSASGTVLLKLKPIIRVMMPPLARVPPTSETHVDMVTDIDVSDSDDSVTTS
jgi:hypothetical protein